MAAPPISKAELQSCVDAVQTHGSVVAAAAALSVNLDTFRSRMRNAKNLGLVPRGMAPDHPRILKGKIKELQTELKKSLQTSSEVEAIKDAVGALRSNVEACEPPKWAQTALAKASSPGVPTLFLSDFHWGERVFSAQVGGVNSFNMKIARERLRHTIDTAIGLCRIISPQMDYPGIVVPLGGDLVSGNLHSELTATNECGIMPVVLDIFGELATAITTLSDTFGRCFIPCVSGNHGRDSLKTWKKDRYATNFDWLICRFLAKRFENDKRVTFFIPDGNDALYKIYNTRYMLTHGDELGRGGDGIIGYIGPVMRGDSKKRARSAQIDRSYDILLHGHYHQYGQSSKIVSNGSLKGMDEYAYISNFSFEPPQQALWITHPKNAVTFRMPVYCEPGKEPRKTAWASVADV
jgi:hypothetical protein